MDASRIRFGRAAETEDFDQLPQPQSIAADRDEALARERAESAVSLLPPERLAALRREWREIQRTPGAEPRETVARADGLAHELLRDLADALSRQRAQLVPPWDDDGGVPTAELQVALMRYRMLFERLLG